MTNKEKLYFNMAKKLSIKSKHPKYKIGAVIVNKHKAISAACNHYNKGHPLQMELNKYRFSGTCKSSLHAEVAALLPLINKVDLSGASVFTYREYKNGELAMSRPCPACLSLIKECNIKKIYYTTKDGFAKEILL